MRNRLMSVVRVGSWSLYDLANTVYAATIVYLFVPQFLANTADNGLGMPLPRGRLRFYQRDDDGQLEFVGENDIDHTPKDETVRVYTGNSFDLVGQRRRTEFTVKSAERWLDESFEVKLRNHKDKPVEIRVVEHLYRWNTWELKEHSHPFTKTDAQTIEFRVQVPPNGEVTLDYTVHYTW